MFIKNEDLKNYISGAVRFDENGGFLFPRRFTKHQSDYVAKNSFLYPRSKMTAGVTLEFYSTTQKISFDAIFLETSRNYYSFDIYVDGVVWQSLSKGDVKIGSQEHLEFKLEEGNKKIQIYFPCLFETGIKNFVIDDSAKTEKIEKGKSFLFLGDSITHGYATKFTSLTYTNILSRKFNAETLNQAIAGDVFNVNNLDEDLNFNPDIVFVAYGTNDWWNGFDITDSAKKYFDKLTKIYGNTDIYVILPICRLDYNAQQENAVMPFCDFRNLLKSLCGEYKNITVIDGWNFVPHFCDFYEDGFLHPNDMGFIFYAEALKNYIIYLKDSNERKSNNEYI